MMDKYIPGLLLSYNIACVGMFYAIFVFYRLSKQVSNLHSLSLSESYEMRQIMSVLAWLKRLIKAFFIGVLANLPSINLISYLHFNRGYDEDDPLILFILTVVFTVTDVYCLITTLYMYQEFPQLRNAVCKDFPCLKISKPAKVLTTTERNAMYFDSLRSSWKHPHDSKKL
uniref:G_PROTEIN_RECEP_F1_2 domain-containing protein n=2 Tax=Bursaphelenchus xylophilus TaxID=6326 RepID=A0A1I7RJP0_BURXY